MVDDVGQVPSGAGGSPVAERMQALLSRAVEDQIGEQRQVAAVVGELREQVAALSSAYRATATESGLQQLGEAVAAQAPEVRAVRSALEDRLDALSLRLEEVAARQEALRTVGPADLAEAVAGLAGRLDLLAAQVEAGQQRLAEHVDEAVLVLAEALLRRRRAAGTDSVAGETSLGGGASPAVALPVPSPEATLPGDVPAVPVVGLLDTPVQEAGTGDLASLAAAVPTDDVFPEVLGHEDDTEP